ncbi:MAG: DUF2277 domain-containing protein [Actinobacteria bacterium]|nr:DUF2277 domain-containing protein [Actinomycetota bacterium]
MCRSIRTLRAAEPHPTTGDVEAAARQYVRKLSGYRTPSRANAAVFDSAIAEVAAATERMLAALGTEPVTGPEQPPVRRPG